MNRLKALVIFTLCLFTLLTCGIEDLLYLPQVSQSGIASDSTSNADITIPPISKTDFYHATGYLIFYKIYISDFFSANRDEIINNIPSLLYDYNTLSRFTDPTNASSIPSLTTFSGRGFYELALDGVNINTILEVLDPPITTDVFFRLFFPTSAGRKPYLDQDTIENGNEYFLFRSNGGGTFNPVPNRDFINSTELNKYENATSILNADVSGQSNLSGMPHAYASMYIVAVGINDKFSRVYGKPTFINIFRLPDIN
jgi:hypothetical protein